MTEVLNAKTHSRLLADQDHVCIVAGVQKRFLHSSMTQFCGPKEVEWVKKFHKYLDKGIPGLVLHGVSRPDTRCQAIAGALMRNFIDARVVPINTLITAPTTGVSASVLLVPNLFVNVATKSQAVPAWKVQSVYDLLLNRATQAKPSVVYVEDLTSLATVYGAPFRDFLDGFQHVTT